MYGLVNKALEDMVCNRYSEEMWAAIKQQAGVAIDVFVSLESYPDAITYQLVEAASAVLGLSLGQVLEAFGEYWVLYTGREGYNELFTMWGDDLRSFLLNLNNMHARIGLSFPQLKPPSFECTDVRQDSLVLHYYSFRPDLAPMVIGLLKGLGMVFATPIEVTQTAARDSGADHDLFLVRFEKG